MVLRQVDREMTSQLRSYPGAKSMVSVAPVSFLPGALNASLPFFSVQNGRLYFRADDPNLYGIVYQGGLTAVPRVNYNNRIRAGNKGCNFYSAPWCIPTLPCRDTGKRVQVESIDSSIYSYLVALYIQLTNGSQTLTQFTLEKTGWAKQYQIQYGNQYTNVNGAIYFGGSNDENPGTAGVSVLTQVSSPLLSSTENFTYNGASIQTWQQPYNTFFAIDTPIVISAIDTSNGDKKVYFTLHNSVSQFNAPVFNVS